MTLVGEYARRLTAMFFCGSLGMFLVIISVSLIDLTTDVAGEMAGRLVMGVIVATVMGALMIITFVYCMNVMMKERRQEDPPEAMDDPENYEPPSEVPDTVPESLDAFTREYGRPRSGSE